MTEESKGRRGRKKKEGDGVIRSAKPEDIPPGIEQAPEEPLVSLPGFPFAVPRRAVSKPPLPELSEEDQKLFDQVAKLLSDNERMLNAVQQAAGQRYTPGVYSEQADEHDQAVFGDLEYDTTLSLGELFSQVQFMTGMAAFFGVDQSLIANLMTGHIAHGLADIKKTQIASMKGRTKI